MDSAFFAILIFILYSLHPPLHLPLFWMQKCAAAVKGVFVHARCHGCSPAIWTWRACCGLHLIYLARNSVEYISTWNQLCTDCYSLPPNEQDNEQLMGLMRPRRHGRTDLTHSRFPGFPRAAALIPHVLMQARVPSGGCISDVSLWRKPDQ